MDEYMDSLSKSRVFECRCWSYLLGVVGGVFGLHLSPVGAEAGSNSVDQSSDRPTVVPISREVVDRHRAINLRSINQYDGHGEINLRSINQYHVH